MADFALRSALGHNEQLGAGLSILGSPGLFVPSEPPWSCPQRTLQVTRPGFQPSLHTERRCHPQGAVPRAVSEGGTAGTVHVCLAAQTEAGL